MKIAFDIDDTLIVPSVATGLPTDTPNYENIAVFLWFQKQEHAVGVWSGGGVDYAKMWAEKLGLKPDFVHPKEKREDVDICFDDCDVDLARVNIKVKRINNSISRGGWNKHETEKITSPYHP
ncbi:MAG: hypothetical protein HY376_02275 [Candidatus Blackburnbacteria bacterium]|nr:hypothetical protein [Candidatus Blackburnbacteria bacterium]